MSASDADLTTAGSKLCKANLVGKTADAVDGNSFVKNKNSCSTKIFKQFLEITRNGIY